MKKLPAASAAALINFYPETMTRFTPVYDNNNYRIVRVLYEGDKKEDYAWERGYSSYYDPSLFIREGDYFVGTAESVRKITEAAKIIQDMDSIMAK